MGAKDELVEFAEFWKSLSGLATAVLGASPLSSVFLESIFPPGFGYPYLYAMSITAVAVLFTYLYSRGQSVSRLRRQAAILGALSIIALIVYVAGSVAYTDNVDEFRFVTGWEKTPEVVAAIGSGDIIRDNNREIIAYVGYDSIENAWTHHRVISFVLMAAICLSFAFGATSFATFAADSLTQRQGQAAEDDDSA